MIVHKLLEPELVAEPSAAWWDIGIVIIRIHAARRFRCSDVVEFFVKQRLSSLPMSLADIGGFVTGISQHISKALEMVMKTDLATGSTIRIENAVAA